MHAFHSTPRAKTCARPWCTCAVMRLSGSSSPSTFQWDSSPTGVTATALHSTTSTNGKRPGCAPATHACNTFYAAGFCTLSRKRKAFISVILQMGTASDRDRALFMPSEQAVLRQAWQNLQFACP